MVRSSERRSVLLTWDSQRPRKIWSRKSESGNISTAAEAWKMDLEKGFSLEFKHGLSLRSELHGISVVLCSARELMLSRIDSRDIIDEIRRRLGLEESLLMS